jgi:LmbE family N-acetylglucosaminyl deacetylase
VVREVAPEIILTHALRDYMEDHMNAARLAVTAAFCRGMPNYPVDPPRAPADQDVTVYHAQPHGNFDEYGRVVRPEFCVDVTDMQERKAALLAQHASQKAWLDRSQGMDSYLITMRERDREVGRMSGRFAAAEGWRTHYRPGFCADGADPIAAALGPARIVRLP